MEETIHKASEKLKHPRQSSIDEPEQEIPHHTLLSSEMVRRLGEKVAEDDDMPDVKDMSSLSGHSNEIIHLNMDGGRSLIIKRARYDWAASRFRNAQRASVLLRGSSLVVPDYFLLTGEPRQRSRFPVLAYNYIPLPTLENLWPELSSVQRKEVVRSLGHLLREVHRVEVEKYGSFSDDEYACRSLAGFLKSDLRERLELAVWSEWPEALPLVDRLARMIGNLPEQEGEARLVHNDLHMGNILCEKKGKHVRCVGLLDLETAGGGRPETDLASASVLHDPLFADEYGEGDWSEKFDRHLQEGYGKKPDPDTFRFFRVYHLLNLGFFSALAGDEWHAGRTAAAIREILNIDDK